MISQDIKKRIKNLSFAQIVEDIRSLDMWILCSYIALSLFGLVMVYSASTYYALAQTGSSETYLIKQIIFIILGVSALGLVIYFGDRILKSEKWMIGFGIIQLALLVIVLFTEERNGARSWINVGGFNIQPSEIAKLYIIWISSYVYSELKEEQDIVRYIRIPVGVTLVVLAFVMMQPDMGTAMIIALIALGLFVSTGFYKYGMPVLTGVLALGYLFTYLPKSFLSKLPIAGYQINRLVSFHNPWEDRTVTGWQSIQGLIGLARGGWTGNGIGNSIQKTGSLPEAHTDFILAIVGEELGFIWIIVIITILYAFILRIFYKGMQAKSLFSKYICMGVGLMFLIQSSINIAALLGLAPITGVPLPFISYGGSSYIVSSVAVALVLYAIESDKRMKIQ
ncbi:cell division protein FtsW [Granulicatella balaenopterae]|uniref:Probable peptidoglycan glycosyltransferase FtsW n=1 Tax=Granulicatella balaenopterae TaxID=137733 RepID=A0A1H9IBA1_9LACT|nr:putative peptidoglycan glycosyltransferase FtsW [Granulicatella balaenopterae]SEQ71816.1 cell division protein FtsW [Granulicatella balaenopterae]